MSRDLQLVSSCLAGIPCRYNGKSKADPEIIRAVAEGRAIIACAEELGELPTPRPAAEIVGGDGHDVLAGTAIVRDIDGLDVTSQFVAGAQAVAQLAAAHDITEAVLQSRSPSCGCGKIYDGTHTGTLIEGDGVLVALLKQRGLRVTAQRGH